MYRAMKLGVLGAVLALVAVAGMAGRGGTAAPVSAQVPVTNCVNGVSGTETCTFPSAVAINNNTLTPATITINVVSPAGVTVTAASASDGAHTCSTSGGANTSTLTLTCANGLNNGGTITATFSQQVNTITANLTYNADQTAQSALTASCSLPAGANAGVGTNYNGASGVATPPGPCSPGLGGALTTNLGCSISGTTFSCSNTLNTSVTAGNTATVTVDLVISAAGLYQVTTSTNPAGTCPFVQVKSALGTSGTLPSPGLLASNNNITLTYVCGASQSIPAGTTITVAGTCTNPCSFAQEGTGQNIGCTGSEAQPSPCAAYAGASSQTLAFQNLSIAPTATPVPTATATPTPGGTTVAYAAGWNLVGAPAGTTMTGASVPLYTFQATDSSYEMISSTVIGASTEGFWAYFNSPATVSLATVSGGSTSVSLPVNHYIMAGNPFDRAAIISAAGATIDTYNSVTGYATFTGTATLAPGQGAWVISSAGGTLTITST